MQRIKRARHCHSAANRPSAVPPTKAKTVLGEHTAHVTPLDPVFTTRTFGCFIFVIVLIFFTFFLKHFTILGLKTNATSRLPSSVVVYNSSWQLLVARRVCSKQSMGPIYYMKAIPIFFSFAFTLNSLATTKKKK